MSAPILDPDLLKAFVAEADSRSFTRAASQLNRTQSAVSMQIKRLEGRLGVELFNRTKAHVDLSSAGEGLPVPKMGDRGARCRQATVAAGFRQPKPCSRRVGCSAGACSDRRKGRYISAEAAPPDGARRHAATAGRGHLPASHREPVTGGR